MTTEKPSNENMSFAMLVNNPQRDKAENMLTETLADLEFGEGIPGSLLAEVMFDLVMFEMQPTYPISKKSVVKWFCQLHRFSKTIDDQLEALSDVYKKESK
ncbi:MAG: hypothetical protein KAH96_06210 [Alphaproteobacteria bacterium]|nr:hypothetical protein [Alphaproteobacteria bacterium]